MLLFIFAFILLVSGLPGNISFEDVKNAKIQFFDFVKSHQKDYDNRICPVGFSHVDKGCIRILFSNEQPIRKGLNIILRIIHFSFIHIFIRTLFKKDTFSL
jgi:hypothetical protein